MIRASKIIPIVDDNRQFQGIQVIDFIKNSKKEKAKEIAKALERAGY